MFLIHSPVLEILHAFSIPAEACVFVWFYFQSSSLRAKLRS